MNSFIKYFLIITLAYLGNSCSKENSINNIFIGDSHIERYDVKYFFPSFKIVNSGISGEKISETTDRINSLTDTSANCIIEIGINDYTSGLGKSSLENVIVTRYKKLLEAVHNNFKKIVIISILPPTESFFYSSRLESIECLNTINRRIKEFVIYEENMIFIEADLLLDSKGFLNSRFSDDGQHLNQRGYLILTSLLRDYVE